MTTAVALAVHIFGAVIWVGGMFAIYVCLRPALGTLDPPQRLRLMRVTFQKFFLWVWVAIGAHSICSMCSLPPISPKVR